MDGKDRGLMFVLALWLLLCCHAHLAFATPPWPHPYWDIPGDYCRERYPSGQCCAGRQDPCSVPILGTLCYCDTFCNRTSNSDCCPDYFTHCEGLREGSEWKWNKDDGGDDDRFQYAEGAPEEKVFPGDLECPHGVVDKDGESRCFKDGRFYSTRETVAENCNTCRCQVSLKNPRCMELLCETDACIVDQRVVRELEEGPYSWKPASNYSDFWGRSLKEGVRGKLGTFKPKEPHKWNPIRSMSAIKASYDESQIPEFFDAREKWPGKIQAVRDQGWCGASWAFSTSSVASDRLAIEGESTGESMSPQALISCDTQGQAGCRGGYVDRAWNYLRRFGTVPDSCYPFTSAAGYGSPNADSPSDPADSCLVPRSHHLDVIRALGGRCPTLLDRKKLFRTQPAYRVGRHATPSSPRRRELDIMHEVMTRGPVQALMEARSDLFIYGSGVYRATNLAEPADEPDASGFHSVKIVGWGREGEDKYWLCMNSWGRDWGEDGLFRIARGENECKIEEYVIGVWAQTESRAKKSLDRRRRRLRLRRWRRLHRMQQQKLMDEEAKKKLKEKQQYFQVG